MKKIISALLACACAFCVVSTSALASSQTDITFELKNDPVYTVTIPSDITLAKEGASMEIVAEDVAYLDNQKVSVTIEGTDKYRNQMLLEGKTATGSNASLRYQIVLEDGTVIETTGGKDQVNGVELASFTDNGSATLTFIPVLTGSSSIKTDVVYTGSITYGISLVDIA